MPCNLAVTITKAVAAPEHLLQLLTPEVVHALVDGFVKGHPAFANRRYQPARISEYGEMITLTLGYGRQITIMDGQVQARFPRGEEAKGEELAQLLTTLLAKGADRLFAQQVKKSLQSFGQVQEQQAKVRDGEQVVPVTMFRLEVQ